MTEDLYAKSVGYQLICSMEEAEYSPTAIALELENDNYASHDYTEIIGERKKAHQILLLWSSGLNKEKTIPPPPPHPPPPPPPPSHQHHKTQPS